VEQLFVSVIMPVRNEELYIERSLLSVMRQDYPYRNMEIIVVDGMSDDATKDIVSRIRKENKNKACPEIIIIDNPSRITAVALNIGLQQAKGEIIARVDGHCQIPSSYITGCIAAIERTGADCVGGLIKAVPAETVKEKAIALATTSPFGVGSAKFRYHTKSQWVDTVFVPVYRRSVFTKIGMFDEELIRNQDDEFNFRLRQAGGRIWFEPSLRLQYYPRTTLTELKKQYFQYGFWKVRVFQKRGVVASLRHIVPLLFVLGLAVSLVLFFFTQQPLVFLILIGSYSMVNLFFSIIRAKGDLRLAAMLFFAFFIIHFSYGLGFLCGLFKWRKGGFKFLLPKWHLRRTSG